MEPKILSEKQCSKSAQFYPVRCANDFNLLDGILGVAEIGFGLDWYQPRSTLGYIAIGTAAGGAAYL